MHCFPLKLSWPDEGKDALHSVTCLMFLWRTHYAQWGKSHVRRNSLSGDSEHSIIVHKDPQFPRVYTRYALEVDDAFPALKSNHDSSRAFVPLGSEKQGSVNERRRFRWTVQQWHSVSSANAFWSVSKPSETLVPMPSLANYECSPVLVITKMKSTRSANMHQSSNIEHPPVLSSIRLSSFDSWIISGGRAYDVGLIQSLCFRESASHKQWRWQRKVLQMPCWKITQRRIQHLQQNQLILHETVDCVLSTGLGQCLTQTLVTDGEIFRSHPCKLRILW